MEQWSNSSWAERKQICTFWHRLIAPSVDPKHLTESILIYGILREGEAELDCGSLVAFIQEGVRQVHSTLSSLPATIWSSSAPGFISSHPLLCPLPTPFLQESHTNIANICPEIRMLAVKYMALFIVRMCFNLHKLYWAIDLLLWT